MNADLLNLVAFAQSPSGKRFWLPERASTLADKVSSMNHAFAIKMAAKLLG